MTDEKNQDGLGDEEAARRLAEQRKALNLQTRPLEVIADLDWDVEDDGDDFGFSSPAAAPVAAAVKEPAPSPAAEPAAAAPVSSAPVSSSGTMMMSATDFRQALHDETASESVTAVVTETVKEQVTAPMAEMSTRGGTMLITGDAMADAMEAAKMDAADSDAAAENTVPTAAVEGADAIADIAPHQQTSSGTMLMSAAAIHAQLEQEADVRSSQLTPAGQPVVSDDHVKATQPQPVVQSAPAQQPQQPAWGNEAPQQQQVWANPADAKKSAGNLTTADAKRTKLFVIAGVLVLAILVVLFLINR